MIPVITAGILLGAIGYVGLQDASAHQTISGLSFGTITVGHDGEPAFGHKPGVWLGKHNTEIFLRNGDIPISEREDENVDVNLYVDKYYFKNVKKFNKADALEDADAISLNNPLNEVFGENGTYHSEQIIQSGIYGYAVHGTITIDGETNNVNVTLFCHQDGMDEDQVELFENGSEGEIGERDFGCPRDIDDIKFPADNNKNKHNNDN